MIATSTTDGEDFVAPDSHVPATSEARETKQGLPEDREGMLQLVRGAFPDLKAEDAFEVPTWFPQQKKWVEDPAGSETVVYNFPLGLRIRGALEPGALRKGLQEIVRRHGVFRSIFRVMEGRVIQIVLSPQELSLPATQLSGPPEERERKLRETFVAESMRPFDLTRDAILRCHLVRLAEDDWALLLLTHTLVYDDWSSGVLIHELSEAYSAFASGGAPAGLDLQFQFGDFVRWQRERLRGPETEEHLEFCRQQLASKNGFEHLTPDFARPAARNCAGAKCMVVLPQVQVDSLMVLSRQEHVSPFMVLLSGFKALLHYYSGDEEIGIASCAANRQLEEVEGLIGRFGNSMLLKTSLAGNPTFGELFRRVQEVTLEGLSRLEVPFGMVLERIGGPEGSGAERSYQIMFILQNAPKERWQLPGLGVEWSPIETPTSKLDLIVWLKTEPRLEITLEYATQVFAPSSMSRLLADYQSILETMVKEPNRRINDSPVSARRELATASVLPVQEKSAASSKDRSVVEQRMIELWKGAFKPRPVDVTKNFFEMGGDSLLAVRLFGQINKAFQCKMPLSVLLGAPTIPQLVQIIVDSTPVSSSLVVPIQVAGAKPPLFFVHGSGGEPTAAVELSRYLGTDQPFYGLRSRSLCGEPAQHTVREMAEYYVKCIRGIQPKGPYYLTGFCFGGLVVYEMARILTSQGENIALLVAFDTPAPGMLRKLDILKNRIRHDLWKISRRELPPSISILSGKNRRVVGIALRSLKVALYKIIGKSPGIDPTDTEQVYQAVSDANIAAAKSYFPDKYSGRITLFVTPEALALYGYDLQKRWESFAQGGVELHLTEGDHLGQLENPFVKSVAAMLEKSVAQAGEPKQGQPFRPLQGVGLHAQSYPRAKGSVSLAGGS